MKRKVGLVAALLVAAAFTAFAAQQPDGPIQIGIRPSVDVPIGTEGYLYAIGGGGHVTGRYAMPFFRPLSVGLDLGYHLAPLATSALSSPDSLSLISGAAMLQLRLVAWGFLEFVVSAEAGWYLGFLNGDPASNGNGFFSAAILGIGYRINQYLSVGLQSGPLYFLGLYQAPVGAGLYLDVRLGE